MLGLHWRTGNKLKTQTITKLPNHFKMKGVLGNSIDANEPTELGVVYSCPPWINNHQHLCCICYWTLVLAHWSCTVVLLHI